MKNNNLLTSSLVEDDSGKNGASDGVVKAGGCVALHTAPLLNIEKN
jgi:hypothetical protein